MKPLKLQKKNWPYKFKCDLYNDFDPNVHVVNFGGFHLLQKDFNKISASFQNLFIVVFT